MSLMLVGCLGGFWGLVLTVTSVKRELEPPPIPPAQAVSSRTSPIVPMKTEIRIVPVRLVWGVVLIGIAAVALRAFFAMSLRR